MAGRKCEEWSAKECGENTLPTKKRDMLVAGRVKWCIRGSQKIILEDNIVSLEGWGYWMCKGSEKNIWVSSIPWAEKRSRNHVQEQWASLLARHRDSGSEICSGQ